MKNYKIKNKNILGHSDISPDRKKDPGEKFPWKDLFKDKLVYWHSLEEKILRKNRLIKLNRFEEKQLLNNLFKIGYDKLKSQNYSSKKRILLKAFQRRYRQNLINGLSDQECLLISKNLIK